ncbi:MAG: hypothetical protein WBX01_05610 [Nitrososphaeraceae archaeon]
MSVDNLENWSVDEACQGADLECSKLTTLTSAFNKMIPIENILDITESLFLRNTDKNYSHSCCQMNGRHMFIIATMTVMLIGTTALTTSNSVSAIPLTFGIAAPIDPDLVALGSQGVLSGTPPTVLGFNPNIFGVEILEPFGGIAAINPFELSGIGVPIGMNAIIVP